MNDKPPAAKPTGIDDVQLPQTDAGTTLRMWLGLLLLLVGLGDVGDAP